MPVSDLRLGQLVTSRAGRDSGKPFFIIGRLDERYVVVADGETRGVGRPKRKNVRHVRPHTYVDENLAARLERDDLPSDVELKAMLEQAVREAAAAGGSMDAGAS